MNVLWTPEALQDRNDIWDHIATDNPLAAVHMDELFSDCANRLSEHPKMGRPGKIPGTRELGRPCELPPGVRGQPGHGVDTDLDPHRPTLATDQVLTPAPGRERDQDLFAASTCISSAT